MPEYAHPLTPVPGYSRYANFPPALGDIGATTPDAGSIAAIAAQGAATTASILGGLSAMTTAAGTGILSGAMIGGMAASTALPLIGAAVVGLVAVGIAIANQFQGCGQTCIAATQIANQVEAYLAENLHHYLDSPVHYRSMQLAAINNFNTAWNAIVKACGDPALSTAGVNCIHNRQEGSCDFHNGPDGWGTGPCWNWFTGYLDPIRNDPNVVPDPAPVPTSITGQPLPPQTISVMNADGSISVVSAPTPSLFGGSSASGVSMTPLLVGAALIVAAMVLGGGN